MNLKLNETKDTTSFRINVISGRFGLSREVPAIDYAGADNEKDVFETARRLKKAGFDVTITRVDQTFTRIS